MQPTSPAEQVAATVRAEMARRRVTQTALADVLGMTQTALSRRISGAIPFDVNELHAIAEHLGLPPAALLGQTVSAA